MKIATWNIGGGFIYSQESGSYDVLDLEYFNSELRKVDADVICLQEAHYVSDSDNQASQIAKELGMQHVVFPHAPSHIDSSFKLAVAILSRKELFNVEQQIFHNPHVTAEWRGKEIFSNNKGMIAAKMKVDDKAIRIVSGHNHPFRLFGSLMTNNDILKLQADLFSFFHNDGKLPCVGGFDLNYPNHSEFCSDLLGRGFRQIVPKGDTEPKYGLAIDKILVSKEWGLVPGSAKILSDGKADHFLCVAEVELL